MRRQLAILATIGAVGVAGCGSGRTHDAGPGPARSTVATTVATTAAPTAPPSTANSSGAPRTTSPPQGAGRLGPGSKLRLDGVGPVRVGMTLDEARRAAGVALTETKSPFCRSLTPADGSFQVELVAESGDRITFVSVSQRPITTVSGIGAGSTEAEVMAAYPGQIRVGPGAPGRHTLFYRTQGTYGMSLLVDDGKVVEIVVGVRARAEADERCG
jgi:hypothetical protein